jgi:hypothetical protein
MPGRHTISLLDAQGKTIDEVHVEVRGAALRTTTARAPTTR